MKNRMGRSQFRVYALLAAAAILTTHSFQAFACSDWTEVTTERFRLYSRLRADKAVKIAEALNRFETAIEIVTNARSAKAVASTTIVVFDGAEWLNYFPRDLGGLFRNGQFENTILVVEPDPQAVNPYSIAMHEYVHYVVHSQGGFSYPSWYDEGLAEVLSAAKEDATNFQLGLLWRERLRDAKQSAYTTSLQTILANTSPLAIHDPQRAGEFYGQSTLLAHYLLFSPKRNAQLLAYLQAVNRGEPSERAFAKTFDITSDDLEKELRDYSRQKDFPGFTLPKTMLASREPPASRSISCTDGMLIAGNALLKVGASPAAVSSEYLRDTDKKSPLAGLRLAKARASIAMKEPAKANALIDDALRAPNITGADILFAAQLLMMQLTPQSDGDASLSADDRKLLERARALLKDSRVRDLKTAEAAYAIARVAVELKSDLDDALEIAFQALDRTPKNPHLAEVTALLCELKSDPGNAAGAWSIVAAYSNDSSTRRHAKEAMAAIDDAARAARK